LIPKKFATPNLKPTNRPETSINRPQTSTLPRPQTSKYRTYERGCHKHQKNGKYECGYLGTIKGKLSKIDNWDFRLGFCSLVRSASLLLEYATLFSRVPRNSNAHKPTKLSPQTTKACGSYSFDARLNILSIYID